MKKIIINGNYNVNQFNISKVSLNPSIPFSEVTVDIQEEISKMDDLIKQLKEAKDSVSSLTPSIDSELEKSKNNYIPFNLQGLLKNYGLNSFDFSNIDHLNVAKLIFERSAAVLDSISLTDNLIVNTRNIRDTSDASRLITNSGDDNSSAIELNLSKEDLFSFWLSGDSTLHTGDIIKLPTDSYITILTEHPNNPPILGEDYDQSFLTFADLTEFITKKSKGNLSNISNGTEVLILDPLCTIKILDNTTTSSVFGIDISMSSLVNDVTAAFNSVEELYASMANVSHILGSIFYLMKENVLVKLSGTISESISSIDEYLQRLYAGQLEPGGIFYILDGGLLLVADFLNPFINGFTKLFNVVSGFTESTISLFTSLLSDVKGIYNQILDIGTYGADLVKSFIGPIFTSLMGLMKTALGPAIAMAKLVMKILAKLFAITIIIRTVIILMTELDSILNLIREILDKIVKTVSAIFNPPAGVDLGVQFTKEIGTFFTQMGTDIYSYLEGIVLNLATDIPTYLLKEMNESTKYSGDEYLEKTAQVIKDSIAVIAG